MSTALSYHSSRSRASSRLEAVRTEMDRSSAYMYGSSTLSNRNSSYEPLKRETSYIDTGRSRTRTRDHSADFSAKYRRSSSLEISAPIKPRLRDRSSDFSLNGIERISTRPRTSILDSKYEAKDYKDLTTNADKYLTMQKYRDYDKTKEIDKIVEEERRSKAYSKIINQSSTYQQEQDASRACLSDIFMNTGGFSAKTCAAITKEIIYKEDKGPRNYGWRKEMESYEEKLEVLSAHKRVVQESTKATRDVYRSTDAKIRDYALECKRDVDSSTKDIIIRPVVISEPKTYTSSSGTPKTYSTYSREKSTARDTDYSEPAPKKGSWRKDLERYEEDLELKKVQSENQKKINSYTETSTFQKTATPSIPVHSNNASRTEHKSKPGEYQRKSSNSETSSTTVSKPLTNSWSKPAAASQDTVPKQDEEKKPTYSWKKSEAVPEIKEKTVIVDLTPDISKKEKSSKESETFPKWKKPEAIKKEEPKIEEPKSTPKWKKPESISPEEPKKEEPKVEAKKEEPNPAPKWKKTETAEKEPNVEEPKPTPKWKKSETVMKEEPKPVEESNPVPKWKKTQTIKKEEPKVEESKPAPKWKKPETVKKEEPKVEEPKPVPKWKKTDTIKKEEPKIEEPKPTPKWKKPETVKKEETKPEEPKPVPKWKKPETTKKEESKVEEPKPTPKWKKPETVKKEEPKIEESKPVPKWKKPETAKKEEPKVEEPTPTPKWKKPETVKKEELKVEEPSPAAEEEKVEEKVVPAETKAEPSKEAEGKEGEKKEEEEEEDTTGMRSMRKETDNKFALMDAEFEAGKSKLAALRAKMKRLREASKAAAEADAAADAANRKG